MTIQIASAISSMQIIEYDQKANKSNSIGNSVTL